ncbi:MAG: outer membrane lipid asymmetry maintenance protein MlaD [Magnetococcales bacterium]|nr:outer membrane lipid asymmetry maintenance protein MlaD [Magnetococcales bacterium]MBF0115394.1 outer membrane lipid asymmetry maintenance protein MlaD [Magnetococcales bacterium]
MKSVKLEMMVGLFVLTGLLALAWLSIKLARMEVVGGDHLPIHARFSSIAGLKTGASVEIAGVEVGRVDDISLNTSDFEAHVRMKIKAHVPIQEDAIASVRTKGLIGDRYIVISPGGSKNLLKADETIVRTEPAINFEELISQFIHGSVK